MTCILTRCAESWYFSERQIYAGCTTLTSFSIFMHLFKLLLLISGLPWWFIFSSRKTSVYQGLYKMDFNSKIHLQHFTYIKQRLHPKGVEKLITNNDLLLIITVNSIDMISSTLSVLFKVFYRLRIVFCCVGSRVNKSLYCLGKSFDTVNERMCIHVQFSLIVDFQINSIPWFPIPFLGTYCISMKKGLLTFYAWFLKSILNCFLKRIFCQHFIFKSNKMIDRRVCIRHGFIFDRYENRTPE